MKINISGIKEIQSNLKIIKAGLKDTSELVYKAGLIFEAQTKQNWGHGTHAGGYPNIQTGNLRASVVTRLSSPVKAIVGTNVEYAPHVEFGHRIISHYTIPAAKLSLSKAYSRLVPKFAKAYPFFFPAIDQTKDKIAAWAKSWVGKLIRGK